LTASLYTRAEVQAIFWTMYSSIRSKLTLWYTCVLAFVIIAFSFLTYTSFVRAMLDQTDKNLLDRSVNLVTAIEDEENDLPKKNSTDDAIVEALSEMRSVDYRFVVTHSGDLSTITPNDEFATYITATIFDAKGFGNIAVSGDRYRVHRTDFHLDNKSYTLFSLISLSDQIELEGRVKRIFAIVSPLVLLLVALGGYFLARKTLSPISEIGSLARRITGTDLSERIPISNKNDELGELALAYNDLFDRLDAEFERQRRFMADASHELRTPLAIIQGESEVALANVDRDRDEYRESLTIVNEEGSRMARIVEDLFLLARDDSGQLAEVSLRDTYIDEIVGDCVRSIRSLADKRGISIAFERQELLMPGNDALLKRLFMNLIDNAVKYNVDGGRLAVYVDAGKKTVSVINTGPVIPDSQGIMVFERFVRLHRSIEYESTEFSTGAGLGLSIAKMIAGLHYASIEYSRSPAGENVFVVAFQN